jgi:peptide/nickel transport system permease protein
MTTGIQEQALPLALEVPSRYANWGRSALRFARKQPLGAASAVLLVAMVLVALFAGQIAPYSPTKNDVGPTLAAPGGDHLFGTDQFGRDLFSRVVHGARLSLYVGLATTLIGVALATMLGAVSGYLGGIFDYVIQRFVDAAQAIPPLVLLIGVMVVLGPSVQNVIIALAFRGALSLSRVIRGAVIGVRSHQYIEATRAIGGSHLRTLVRHILPNIFPTVVVLISTSIGANIVAEASLSFLGYGVPPPTATWGGMMSAEGRLYMLVSPWIMVFPTIALSLVVFAMNMLGDALRDEIDPRLRGSR